MKALHIQKKGKMLDTLENYYVYKITKQGIQINEHKQMKIIPHINL
jgi:CRISPR/Cas system-associated endonuclease Cas3-HD